jgi:tetratricopeptide (TPR) repeat protein
MSLVVTAALLTLLGQAPAAEAPVAAEFQPLVEQGLELYKQQKYAQAADVFAAAYALKADPSLVFNIARCYERLPDVPRAITEYRRYLDHAGTTAEQRGKARRALEALEEEAAPPAASPQPVASPAPAASARSTEVVAPPPAKVERSYAPSWILLGVGVAGLGVGTTFAIMASGEAASYRTEVSSAQRVEIEDRARGQALAADIGFGVGAASVVAAAVLFLLSGEDEPAVAIAPRASADGVGLAVGGRL